MNIKQYSSWFSSLDAKLRNIHGGWLLLAGAILFLAIFEQAYSRIPGELYRYRDDGIITLSHARNWIDFGFIGLNPSGERVEATSAPLQMLLYAAAYGLTRVDYWQFIDIQTWACTAALGALFISFFPGRPIFALCATACAAFGLTKLHAFLEWHGSGMENAITHVTMLATVLVLTISAREKRIRLAWVVIPFLASISRVEAVYYIAPLLLVFMIYWSHAVGDQQARRFAVAFSLLWLLFNAWRWFYFGSAQPNTALAQGISVGGRIIDLFTITPIFLDQTIGLGKNVFLANGGYFLILLLPLLFLQKKLDEASITLMFSGVVIILAFLAPIFFGAARLDIARTTTQMAIFSVLAIAIAAYSFRPEPIHTYLIPVFALFFLLIYIAIASGPYHTCCDARMFDEFRKSIKKLADTEGISRATIASPDLGVVSGYKQFNIVDLGLLGSPILSRLREGPAVNAYFYELAAPDIVESHQYWSCLHKRVLLDPRFLQRYAPSPGGKAPDRHCGKDRVPTGIWMRKDMLRGATSAERRFSDDLQRQPSVDRVRAELTACEHNAAASQATACAYVARSAYRLLPEFKAAGERPGLLRVFAQSRTHDFDHYLLAGDTDARLHLDAIRMLKTLAPDPSDPPATPK